MALRFTPEAFSDLSHIDDYLSERSPQGLRHILVALKETFENLRDNPRMGRPTLRPDIRVTIEPAYKHIIPYYLDGGDVWILRVYHPRRAPLDYMKLNLPEG